MRVSSPQLSLVVSTVGRTAELSKLLRNLINQEFKDFEILVVDQNRDSRVSSVLVPYERELDIRLIATPTRQGISCGRNDGWRQARGNVIVFPDDDCWYPSWFLRKGIELLDSTVADLVSGRFADKVGRSINGRFASRAQRITRRNVWLARSKSASFYSRELLEHLGARRRIGHRQLLPMAGGRRTGPYSKVARAPVRRLLRPLALWLSP